MGRGHGATRGGGASGVNDRTMQGYSRKLAKAVSKAESEIRSYDDHERGYTFDEKGNIIDFAIGGSGSVQMNKPFRDRIFTHNHPNHGYNNPFGASLSRGDVKIAMQYDAKEFRAVTHSYTYSLKRPQGGWGNARKLTKAYDRIYYSLSKRDEKYLASYTGDKGLARRRMGLTFAHRVNKEFAKKYGFDYTVTKVS